MNFLGCFNNFYDWMVIIKEQLNKGFFPTNWISCPFCSAASSRAVISLNLHAIKSFFIISTKFNFNLSRVVVLTVWTVLLFLTGH